MGLINLLLPVVSYMGGKDIGLCNFLKTSFVYSYLAACFHSEWINSLKAKSIFFGVKHIKGSHSIFMDEMKQWDLSTFCYLWLVTWEEKT